MSSIIQTVQVVEAVQAFHVYDAKKRIPPELRGKISFFSINDLWLFRSKFDNIVCRTCLHHDGNIFPGRTIRFIWPYLNILDINTIGGSGPGNTGMCHPHCRCRLHRLLPYEIPTIFLPTEIQEEILETPVVTKLFKTLKKNEPVQKLVEKLSEETGLVNTVIYGLLMQNFVYQLSLQQRVAELLRNYQLKKITRKTVIAELEQVLREVSDQQFIYEIKLMIKKIKETGK